MNNKNNVVLLISLFAALVDAAFLLPSRSACRTKPFRTSMFSVSTREPTVMMPPTLERETLRTSGPAVLDRADVKKNSDARKERSDLGDETWEVRIYNDGMNTREHVARALVQITGISEFSAYQTMMRAHQNGIAAVGRWYFEIAEMYNDGLRQNGIISDIVPVEEEQ